MKILHTSDWHLGKRLYNHERLSEQQHVLEEINEIADRENVDCIVIAGDIFDVANPSGEATELFYKSVKKLSKNGGRPVVAIAGNHDSPHRIEAPDPLARECGIVLLGYPATELPKFELENSFRILRTDQGFVEFEIAGHTEPLRIIATPYASEIRMKQYLGTDEEQGLRDALQNQWQKLAVQYCDNQGINILAAHLFVWKRDSELPEEPEGEKPVKLGNASVVYTDLFPEQMQYVALGHLHRSQAVDGGGKVPVHYCGSPLAYSFGESGQQKYVHLIDVRPDQEAKIDKVALKQGKKLLRRTFEKVDDAVKWLKEHQDVYSEITMRTADFLKAGENRRLREASQNLVNIIPEPQNRNTNSNNLHQIDMNQSVTQLFKRYFREAEGQEPNDEIMELFNEVLNQKKST